MDGTTLPDPRTYCRLAGGLTAEVQHGSVEHDEAETAKHSRRQVQTLSPASPINCKRPVPTADWSAHQSIPGQPPLPGCQLPGWATAITRLPARMALSCLAIAARRHRRRLRSASS